MRHRTRAAIAVAIALVATPLAAAPASAAPSDCPREKLCLFDAPGWQGAWKIIDCDNRQGSLRDGSTGKSFDRRASSVINRCPYHVVLQQAVPVGEDEPNLNGYALARQTTVWRGQWVWGLGGSRAMDNQTNAFEVLNGRPLTLTL